MSDAPPRMVDPHRWTRRTLSVGMLFLMTALAVPTAPVWLLLAAAFDLLTGCTVARAGAFVLWYLLCSVYGVLATFGLEVLSLVGRLDAEQYATRHHALQHWWAGQLFGGLRVFFALSLDTDDLSHGPARPLIVLSRHVSTGDTVLPLITLATPRSLRVRYVLKRELLWDPCLDIVGQRVPNAFVRRGGTDSAADVALVRGLAEDAGAEDCIVLFPEGTRFTEARRARVLERLAAGDDPERYRRAEALRHVLPLRMGGVDALLDAAPGADVVFLAHTGLEGVTRMSSLWDGSLRGRRLSVQLRRYPAEAIPKDAGERAAWLHARWRDVDRWVAARAPCANGKRHDRAQMALQRQAG